MRKELFALPSEECKGQCASNTDTELSVRVTNDLQCSQLFLLTHIHTHTHKPHVIYSSACFEEV